MPESWRTYRRAPVTADRKTQLYELRVTRWMRSTLLAQMPVDQWTAYVGGRRCGSSDAVTVVVGRVGRRPYARIDL